MKKGNGSLETENASSTPGSQCASVFPEIPFWAECPEGEPLSSRT